MMGMTCTKDRDGEDTVEREKSEAKGKCPTCTVQR